MKIKDMIDTLLKDTPVLGTFSVSELFRFVKAGNQNGVAATHDEDKHLYLVIVNGEAEGAIYFDEKGELFGDKVVMLIKGQEKFTLHEVKKDLVDAVAMGCRVFEKSHLRANTSYELPEFGTKSAGIGHLTLVVEQGREPQNGIRVSIRKDGKIVGSDSTTQDGSVGFRVMYGNYDIILQDRNQMITTRRIRFDDANSKIILEL
jgi:hypothetical protein